MGFELLTELWRTAATLGATTAIPTPVPAFPRSLEDLLAERGIAVPEPAMPDLTGLYSFAPSETHGRPGLRVAPDQRIALSDTDTTTLLHHARAQGTTLYALLSAAIIRAERAVIGETSGAATADELPMVIGHAVDLRPHLQPPTHPSDTTNGLGCAPTVTRCGPDTDLHIFAKEVKAQIVHSIDSGTALTTILAASRIPENGARDYAANIITNWGVVPALDFPKGMRVVDFRGFVTGDSLPEISYFVYTFQGRLNIEFAYSESTHQYSRITELRRTIAANLKMLIHGLAHRS